jgi:hypothetical protein
LTIVLSVLQITASDYHHKNKCVEKKKKDKKKTLSLEEEYYGPLSKLKKRKSMFLLLVFLSLLTLLIERLPTVSTFIEMFSCSLSNFVLFAIFAHSSPCIISEKIEIIKIGTLVTILVSSAVDQGQELRSGQTI